MPFIEPAFLWASLALVIPVAIHFWHQKRGKLLPWAATRWLTEREQQQSRGLKLDNLWLLLVRCLALILLAVLLAQPLLNWLDKEPTVRRIHLVQPNERVTANFRFELAEARKRDEQVVELGKTVNPLALQTVINNLSSSTTDLHLYLVNDPALTDLPAIAVPKRFQLHTSIDTARTTGAAFLPGVGGRKLIVQAGALVAEPPTSPMRGATAVTDTLRVLLTYKNTEEQKTVRAALGALTDVYALLMRIDEKPRPNRAYDWILTDRTPKTLNTTQPNRQPLYVISDVQQTRSAGNVVFTNETLTPRTSERVASGQLPEWLGTQLLRHYGLLTNRQPVSQRALQNLFVTATTPDAVQRAGGQQLLTLLLVSLLIVERWLALTKNA